ncbi:MAG: VWA domain-containing protein [Planctomycetes bacterium]|nr:VWA domain-containing protein [Planctomycetota bacterium]MBL7039322.1 VWA domain-containing protein [Pirellulaceae bacterium]
MSAFTRHVAASLALVFGLSASMATASQVRLDVSMAKPTLLAKKKQTTHVKIGLTGFKMENGGNRTPVNVSFVLDKSGSMTGDKIAKAKEAAVAAIQRLTKRDIVSVVVYDSTVRVIVPATKLTDRQMVCDSIRRIEAGGTTALFAGVSKGADELRKFLDKNHVNRVVLLSDGLANVGPQSPSELGNLGASLMKEGISVSTMGLGLDYNEDLMSQLAARSSGNHIFIEKASDLVKIFNCEFDDVLSVVAQEVAIDIQVEPGVRPVRVLNMDAEINGQRVIVKMNQLYSQQEKYVLLEVEVPATRAGKTLDVAEVKISYSNMQTKTTDRLSSAVSVNFTDSVAEVEEKTNLVVLEACVLQIANGQNQLATVLRDKGDIEGAKRILIANGKYLAENGKVLDSKLLQLRYIDNVYQAKNLEGTEWLKTRKQMRRLQFADSVQQSY